MRYTLILLSLFFIANVQAQKRDTPATLTYFKNDTVSLKLDLFLPEGSKDKKLPLVIFVHGGAFSGGKRSDGDTLCSFLAKSGYAAASISYTLYMKNKSFGCDGVVSEKIKAIQLAVSDLWQATSFFISNSEKFKIDINKIFLAGSSAGAETALHAAFWDYGLMNIYSQNKIPTSFKYAGLISGSGAIMDINLVTMRNKLPMMLFHGTNDSIVPYATASHRSCKTNASGWMILFGSYSIYNHLQFLNSSVRLYTFCGGGHECAGTLFNDKPQSVVNFLDDVLSGKLFQEHIIMPRAKPIDGSSPYRFCDQ